MGGGIPIRRSSVEIISSLLICVVGIVFICVMQSGISDAESHSNALKILLQMGEFFQIQVTETYQYL